MFDASEEARLFDVTGESGKPDETGAAQGGIADAQARNQRWLGDHFAADSELAGDYLRAGAAYPWLFRQYDLSSVVGHVEGVVDHFKADGVAREDYLGVVASDPTLVLQKPALVIDNIERVLGHFRNDGLLRRDYLQAAIDQPILFRMKPQAVIDNITDVEEWLAYAVTGTADCLCKAVERPRLFTLGVDALGSNSLPPLSAAVETAATATTGQLDPQIPSQASGDAAGQEAPATQVIARVIQQLARVLDPRGRAA
jgi:hypothetical protein